MYKCEHIWLRLDLTTEAEEGLYGFGLQPRPKTILFWPRPNMPRSGNRCRIWKITAAKRPSCTGDGSDFDPYPFLLRKQFGYFKIYIQIL